MALIDYLPTIRQAIAYTGIGVGCAVLAPASLAAAGFGAGGVVAGSVAAGVQSSIGNVAAGSVFASLQSAGVLGLAATTKAAILATGTAAAPIVKNAFTGVIRVCSWAYSRSGITAEGTLGTMRAVGGVGLAATAHVVNAAGYVGRNAVAPAVGATVAGVYHSTAYLASRL